MCPLNKFLLSLVVETCWITGGILVSLPKQQNFAVDISLFLASMCMSACMYTHTCIHRNAHVRTHVHMHNY